MRRHATLVVVATLLVACGGDDNSTSQPPPQGEPRLSKQEFIRQADELCSEYRRKTPDTSQVDEFPELKKTVDDLVALSEETLQKFEGLRPPTADAQVIDSYVDTQRRQIRLLRDVSAAAVERDQAQVDRLVADLRTIAGESKSIARDYGFKVCGSNVDAGPGG